MTEMNQLKYVENAIREALKPRQVGTLDLPPRMVTDDEIIMIRDHLTLTLYPDLVDKETFDSIVFSMYSLMIEIGSKREKFEKLGQPDFICRR